MLWTYQPEKFHLSLSILGSTRDFIDPHEFITSDIFVTQEFLYTLTEVG